MTRSINKDVADNFVRVFGPAIALDNEARIFLVIDPRQNAAYCFPLFSLRSWVRATAFSVRPRTRVRIPTCVRIPTGQQLAELAPSLVFIGFLNANKSGTGSASPVDARYVGRSPRVLSRRDTLRRMRAQLSTHNTFFISVREFQSYGSVSHMLLLDLEEVLRLDLAAEGV
jgi:hypothetical protein